jgi:hypothetical protein
MIYSSRQFTISRKTGTLIAEASDLQLKYVQHQIRVDLDGKITTFGFHGVQVNVGGRVKTFQTLAAATAQPGGEVVGWRYRDIDAANPSPLELLIIND